MDDTHSLKGKVAIVTGAGGGIGCAIARAYVEAGAKVCRIDLKFPDPVKDTLDVVCDVASESATRDVVARVARELGAPGVLVNGAALIDPSATVLDLDLAQWNRILGVNLGGAFLMSKWCIPHMVAAGGGSIIHIASQMGSVGAAGRVAYCAMKGALINMARAMAADHAGQKIRVNTLSPGATETDRMLRFGSMENARAVHGSKHLLNRLARPEEIAAGALFLACDASSFMTGADLLIDGGYNAV
ncbi:MAG: SDR family oxidoreductase [Alphaproteobacteria bacterium]|nr:SDR family oxidoreductase [Alphaproteobacteria bacterium]